MTWTVLSDVEQQIVKKLTGPWGNADFRSAREQEVHAVQDCILRSSEKPTTRSITSPRAVSITMGSALSLRMVRQSSKPSISGSITSRMAASKPGPFPRNSASPALGRVACYSSNPARAKYAASGRPSSSSSSIRSRRGMPGNLLRLLNHGSGAVGPATPAAGHEFAHLCLLLGLKTAVEVGHRGDDLEALRGDGASLGLDEILGLGAVEAGVGHQRLQLGARCEQAALPPNRTVTPKTPKTPTRVRLVQVCIVRSSGPGGLCAASG